MSRLTVASAAAVFVLASLTLMLLRPLTPIDETRYLAVAWEMFSGGSKLVPHLNGEIYGHKPPLLFWMINAVWSVTGVSEFAARSVGPAAAALAVVLTGLVARRLWPRAPGRAGLAALILASLPAFLLYGSATMFDALLTAMVLLSVLGLLHGDHRLVGVGLGLGVLAKGPVALVHVVPLVLSQPLWRDGVDWRGALQGLGLALAVALGIVLLWLGPALVLGGAEYRVEVLWRQSAGRITSSFAHQQPFWFYLVAVPLLVWPFGWGGGVPRPGGAAARMLAVWILAPLVFFSLISGKQLHYLLPELPAVALLLSTAATRPAGVARRVLMTLPLLAVPALAIAAGRAGAVPVPALGLGFAALAVLAGLAGFLLMPPPTGPAALALAAALGLHLAAAPVIHARYDTRPIARVLARHGDRGIALMDDDYHGQFNFTARLREPVSLVPDAAAAGAWAAVHPGGLILAPEPAAPQPGWRLLARMPLRGESYAIYQVPGVSDAS